MNRPDLDAIEEAWRTNQNPANRHIGDQVLGLTAYARELEAQLEALKQRGLQLGGQQIARINELEAALEPFAGGYERWEDYENAKRVLGAEA